MYSYQIMSSGVETFGVSGSKQLGASMLCDDALDDAFASAEISLETLKPLLTFGVLYMMLSLPSQVSVDPLNRDCMS